jgi:uncharacterized alkaline shock family protein YloU
MVDAGDYKMRPGILELIAGISLSRIEGTSGVGIRSDHPEDAKKRKSLSKGIKSDLEEGRVSFEMEVQIDYGKDGYEVGRLIQKKVKAAVEGMTGWTVDAVDVNIVGVNAL